MQRVIRVATAVTALALVAGPAAAQMHGNPVYVPVGMGTGVMLAGDYGRGLNDASFKTNYFGARAVLGLPFFYVMAGVGSVKPDVTGAESAIAFGADVGVNIINLPVIPVKVSAQIGAGYLKEGDDKQLDVPIAVAVGLKLPTPGFSISPWVAPRLHIRRFDPAVGSSDTDAKLGMSGGINAKIGGMFGVHLAVDYIRFGDPDGTGPLTASDASPLVFGAGLSVGLTLPGL